jgi:superfamily I DNA/RNA helicase
VIEHRVFGPPGTGKTTFLGRQAQLASRKYRPQDVMIASLTRAAAKEIGGRRTGVPPENVGTLHAHCFRALDRPLLAESPDGVEEWNRWTKGSRMFRITPQGAEADSPYEIYFENEGDQLLAEMSTYRARMTPREVWKPKVRRFAERWDSFKRATARRDFTDLIEECLSVIAEPPTRPRVMMLDEAQDLSQLELSLARKWAATCEQIVIVGDPDQNLYEWRGTDPDAMTRGEAASTRTLEQSFRVPKAVHAYAVEWIEKIADREPIVYKPTDEEGEVRRLVSEWPSPEGLVKQLRKDSEEGVDSMVLATCGYMLNPLCAVMKKEGLPFHNPYRVTHGGWNPMRGTRRLASFIKPLLHDGASWTWADVEQWIEPLTAKSVMVRGAKVKIGEAALHRASEEATIDELHDYFLPDALPALIECDLDWYRSHVRASRAEQMCFGIEIARRRGIQVLEKEPLVTVGTIHSVKGGESTRVYVWPDMSRVGFWSSWQGGRKARASVIRQFYVAFTRARETLTVLTPAGELAASLPRPK